MAGINVAGDKFANENRTKAIHTWTPMVKAVEYIAADTDFKISGGTTAHGLKMVTQVLFTDVGLFELNVGSPATKNKHIDKSMVCS